MADINVTPLVDVMLVLLIIFMVTAPILSYPIDIDLPQRVRAILRRRTRSEPPPPIKLRIDAGRARSSWNDSPTPVSPHCMSMMEGRSAERDPTNQPDPARSMSIEEAQYET